MHTVMKRSAVGMKKTILSALLALCTAALLTTVSFAADKTVSSWSELADAIQSTDTSPSITLSCDITAGKGDGEITVSGTSTVRLNLNGHVLDGAMRTRIFLVQDGGRLVITDSDAQKRGALVGGSAEDASVTHSGGGVYVAAGGQLELNGATIRDCQGAYGGGAVCTQGNFYMYNGAVIKDCETWHAGGGGAVYTTGSAARFIMRDTALIDNCSFCGVWVEEGTFSMEGGTIRGCESRSGGGGIYVSEGAVFTLSGGLITGNYDGTNKGAAIYLAGTLNLRGGEIADNIVDDMSIYWEDFEPHEGIWGTYSSTINCGGGIVRDNVYLQENARVNDDSFYGTTVFFDKMLGSGDVRGGTYLEECWYRTSSSSCIVVFFDNSDSSSFLLREEMFGGSKPIEPTWLGGEWVTEDGEPFDYSQTPTQYRTYLYRKAETGAQADADGDAAADTSGGEDTMNAGALFSNTGDTSSTVTLLLILSLAGNVGLVIALVRVKKKSAR